MPTIARSILIFAAIGAVMYAVCCAALFVMQRSMIYAPQRTPPDTADTTFSMSVEGARLIVSTRANPGADAVVYFGGNAEDVSQSIPQLQRAFPDRSLFALHYRSYNGSTGEPTETALISDALALFDRVYAAHPQVVLIGRSLGSGVAIRVAASRPVERLVLVTPYDSLQEIAVKRFAYFPVRWLIQDKFESWRYAARVKAPTLLLAAEYDDVIPVASTRLLYEHMPRSLTTLIIVPDAGHNTMSEISEYATLLRGPP